MSKILFANFPWFERDANNVLRKGVRAGSRWPNTYPSQSAPDNYIDGHYLPYPFFMGYAASYVAKHCDGAEVVLRDSIALHEGYASFYKFLQAFTPDFVFIESATPSWPHDAKIIARIHEFVPAAKIVITGPIASPSSGHVTAILAMPGVVATIAGEYEKGAVKVVNGASGALGFELLTQAEMNAAPFPMYSAETVWRYFDDCPGIPLLPHAHVWASRGCPFKCLSGDTPVNTVEGMIPIRDLVGRESIGVFTYDTKEKRAKIATVSDIRKTGENQKLVRVRFDDGSHLDCTPDHRLMVFKWGNQHVAEREWLVEAKDLKPGQRIRSLKHYSTAAGYPVVCWNRNHKTGRMLNHRMVAEWKAGRRLKNGEVVHHIDRDKANWAPGNLQLMASAKEHFAAHPEIAQRMRDENPTRNGIGREWAENLGAANRGKVRSVESRERYRLAAIRREASRTPQEKRVAAERMVAGARVTKPWLAKERNAVGQYNHKVVSVEELPGKHDTFCMEVPETHLFFANNLLVRNCAFCVWPAVMTGNDPDGTGKRSVRFYSPDYMTAFLSELVAKYRLRSIYFDDDTFNLSNRHTLEMCAVMRKIGLPWSAMCRADTSTREVWREMRDSGCYGVKLGFESGNQHVVDNIVNKGLNLKEARETVIYLRTLGLAVHGTFTFGHPGETPAMQAETIAYRKSMPLTSYQESGTACIEGTPLHHLETHAGETMAKYPGAKIDENYTHGTDGMKKIADIKAELAKS